MEVLIMNHLVTSQLFTPIWLGYHMDNNGNLKAGEYPSSLQVYDLFNGSPNIFVHAKTGEIVISTNTIIDKTKGIYLVNNQGSVISQWQPNRLMIPEYYLEKNPSQDKIKDLLGNAENSATSPGTKFFLCALVGGSQ